MADATSDQIVAWLKSDQNNESTLSAYANDWLAMHDPKIDAAIALHGRCPKTLEQLFFSTVTTDLLHAIAANPNISFRVRDQILDRWLEADWIHDNDYEMALCLFLNPEIRPSSVMDLLSERDFGKKRKLFALSYLAMNVRQSEGWYESNLSNINDSGFVFWLLRLICNEGKPYWELEENFHREEIISFLSRLLDNERLAKRIRLGPYKQPLPTAKDIDTLLGYYDTEETETPYQSDFYMFDSVRGVFYKLVQLAGSHPAWQRSFAESRDQLLQATFFKSASYPVIFKHATQLRYDIDERYFNEKNALNYRRMPNGELLAEIDDLEAQHGYQVLEWISENRSFYKKVYGRKFLRQLNLFAEYVHKEVRESGNAYEEDYDLPRPLDESDLQEIKRYEERVRQKFNTLQVEMKSISNNIDKNDSGTRAVLGQIKHDLQSLRAEVREAKYSDRGYLINLLRAILGMR